MTEENKQCAQEAEVGGVLLAAKWVEVPRDERVQRNCLTETVDRNNKVDVQSSM